MPLDSDHLQAFSYDHRREVSTGLLAQREQASSSHAYGNTTVTERATAILGNVLGDLHISNKTYLLNAIPHSQSPPSGRRVERANRIANDCTIETITTFDDGHDASTRGSSYQIELRWERKEDIGEGVFGEVHREECVKNQVIKSRAVKVLRLRQLKRLNVDYKKEIGALLKLSQPQYVNRFIEFFSWHEDRTHIYLAMEYIAYGDLTSHIGHGLTEAEGKQIGYQILDGISTMHQLDIVHRDIKPGNIFVVQKSPRWWVKIGDFGLSKSTLTGLTTCHTSVGTNGYQAPEITGFVQPNKPNYYDEKCDIWSYGCTMYEILSGHPPFKSHYELSTFCSKEQLSNNGSLQLNTIDTHGNIFLARLLRSLPADRPSAEQALLIGQAWFNFEATKIQSETLVTKSIVEASIGTQLQQSHYQAFYQTPLRTANQLPDSQPPSYASSDERILSEQMTSIEHLRTDKSAEQSARDESTDNQTALINHSSQKDWVPDVIIGVDFGSTSTTVAWSVAPSWHEPKLVYKWPCLAQMFTESNKVPSQVGYDENGHLIAWGFQCNEKDFAMKIESHFKLHLDENWPGILQRRHSQETAGRFFQDFMSSLRLYLNNYFDNLFHDWIHRKVEFLFAIPTTWRRPSMEAHLERWLQAAGYSTSTHSRFSISMTEAEAVMFAIKRQIHLLNSRVAVLDVGGASTDLNVLSAAKTYQSSAELQVLHKPATFNIGSESIDWSVEIFVRDQLKVLNTQLSHDECHELAEDMMFTCKFEEWKCVFKGKDSYVNLDLPVPPEALPPDANARQQQVVVTAAKLKAIFDHHFDLLFRYLQSQLEKLNQTSTVSHGVEYLILSGGLGASRYLQKRMKAKYPYIIVLYSSRPEHDVVKGLMSYRMRDFGTHIDSNNVGRSYGLLREDRGVSMIKDSLSGKKWEEERITWLIKAGESSPTNTFTKTFKHCCGESIRLLAFRVPIVFSELPVNELPSTMNPEDVQHLCSITAHFDNATKFVDETKFTWSFKPVCYVAILNLVSVVEGGDVKFEIRNHDGSRLKQRITSRSKMYN